MAGYEMNRCSDCGGKCSGLYTRTATEILFLPKDVPSNVKEGIIEDKQHLLDLRVREVAKCALSSEQIIDNLNGLVEGRFDLNGREEVRT